MKLEKLKDLIQKEKNVNVDDEIEWENIFNEKVKVLCENEEETIDFILTCSEDEFDWISNAFEDLILHFKSKRLLEMIKKGSMRFQNLDVSSEILFAEKALDI